MKNIDPLWNRQQIETHFKADLFVARAKRSPSASTGPSRSVSECPGPVDPGRNWIGMSVLQALPANTERASDHYPSQPNAFGILLEQTRASAEHCLLEAPPEPVFQRDSHSDTEFRLLARKLYLHLNFRLGLP